MYSGLGFMIIMFRALVLILSWLGNLGLVARDRRTLLKTGWISHQSLGSLSLYVLHPIFSKILKGPYCLSSSFLFGQSMVMWNESRYTRSPVLYCQAGCLCLSYCFLACNWASTANCAAISDIFFVHWAYCLANSLVELSWISMLVNRWYPCVR